MHISANWKLAIISLVASGLILTQVESAAFAQGQQANAPAAAQESQTPPPAAPQPAQSQAKPKPFYKRLKWILIGAAAVGSVAAVILLKDKKQKDPVVTVGGPIVGNPQ